jgi:hypothetical protein
LLEVPGDRDRIGIQNGITKPGADTMSERTTAGETKLIPCNLIDVPTLDKKSRRIRKDFCENLAVSIDDEGLHQPIGVRPKGQRYELVFGRHRLEAVKKILKWDLIPALVRDLDDAACEQAKTAENLWRQELSQSQRLIEIKKWYDAFAAKHPDQVTRGRAGGKARAAQRTAQRDRALECSDANNAVPSNRESPQPAEDHEHNCCKNSVSDRSPSGAQSFPKMLSAVTGRSVASSTRDMRISKAFTPEELVIMEASNVSQSDMLTMTKIKDPKQRSEVAGLVCGQGLTLTEAMGCVLGSDAPTPEDGKSKKAREAKKGAEAQVVPKMTDEEWFEHNCSDKAKYFADPTRFKANAILWRWLNDARHVFKSKADPCMEKFAKAIPKSRGAWWNQLHRIISVSHPKDWQICDACVGKGYFDESPCKRCYGGGFLTKVEPYL